MQKGNYTQARADVNKALQLDPNDNEAKNLDAELKKKGY
jgi:Tfp pilus assembly protein PilF